MWCGWGQRIGIFAVKCLYRELEPRREVDFPSKVIWNALEAVSVDYEVGGAYGVSVWKAIRMDWDIMGKGMAFLVDNRSVENHRIFSRYSLVYLYLLCTLSSFLLHFILFHFYSILLYIYIGVSILCNVFN